MSLVAGRSGVITVLKKADKPARLLTKSDKERWTNKSANRPNDKEIGHVVNDLANPFSFA